MLLSGILNPGCKNTTGSTCCILALQSSNIFSTCETVWDRYCKEIKVRGTADEQEKNKQIDYQEAIKGDAMQLQRWWEKIGDF